MGFCVSEVQDIVKHIKRQHKAFQGTDVDLAAELFKKAYAGNDLPHLEVFQRDPPTSTTQTWHSTARREAAKADALKSTRYKCPICGGKRTNKTTHLFKHGITADSTPNYQQYLDQMVEVVDDPQLPTQDRLVATIGGPITKWEQTVDELWNSRKHGIKTTNGRKIRDTLDWMQRGRALECELTLDAVKRVTNLSLEVGGFFHKETAGSKAATKAKKMAEVVEYLEFLRECPHLDTTVDGEAWRYGINCCIRRINEERKEANKQKRADDVTRKTEEAKSIIPMRVLAELLDCEWIQSRFATARKVLEGTEEAPKTDNDYRELRDALIAYFGVKCIRRSLELCQATLSDFDGKHTVKAKDGNTYYVVYFRLHKTQMTKTACIVLDEDEHTTMQAYLKHYRTLVADCIAKDCILFPSINGRSSHSLTKCCKYFETSNINRILDRIGKSSGIPELQTQKLNIRRIRKAAIVGYRDQTDDPAKIKALANYASHTVKVQDEAYLTSRQSRQKVETAIELNALFKTSKTHPDQPHMLSEADRLMALLGNAVSESEDDEQDVDEPKETDCLDQIEALPDTEALEVNQTPVEPTSNQVPVASEATAAPEAPEASGETTSTSIEPSTSTSGMSLRKCRVTVDRLATVPTTPAAESDRIRRSQLALTPINEKHIRALERLVDANPGRNVFELADLWENDCKRRHWGKFNHQKLRYYLSVIRQRKRDRRF